MKPVLIDWHCGPLWLFVARGEFFGNSWVACFRAWGHGLHIKPSRGHQPLFSERYGYVRPLYLFGLRIQRLRPFRK